LYQDNIYFLSYVSQFFLQWEMFEKKKSCRENENTHFIFNYFFFVNRPVYEIMRKNTAQPDRPQIIWRTRIKSWIPKATNTYPQCNTYCFSTASMVARKYLSLTLCIHCLSCLSHFAEDNSTIFINCHHSWAGVMSLLLTTFYIASWKNIFF